MARSLASTPLLERPLPLFQSRTYRGLAVDIPDVPISEREAFLGVLRREGAYLHLEGGWRRGSWAVKKRFEVTTDTQVRGFDTEGVLDA